MDSDRDILRLDERDLLEIASALRSGRLAYPPDAIGLGQIVGINDARTVAGFFSGFAARGLNPEQMVWVLQLLAESQRRQTRVEDHIELVVTGPETLGVVIRDTAAVVHELFSGAERSVMVVGYAVHKGHKVFKALAGRMNLVPALSVKMLLDVQRGTSNQQASEIAARFSDRFKQTEWPDGCRLPEVFYYPPSLEQATGIRSCLHAKCVIIDDQLAFVSSANFTEAAQERNIEAGILVRSKLVSGNLAHHFQQMLDDHVLIRLI